MIPNFDIANDVVVEMLLPDTESNVFIIGLSVLGGDDVLGGLGVFVIGESLLGGDAVLGTSSAFTWQQVQADVSRVQTSNGGDIQSSLYFQAQPATARITMQSWVYDPNVNPYIRVNTPIRVRLATEEIDRVLFAGLIDLINVAYRPEQPNLINITAYDIWKSLVNTRIETFDTTSYGAYITPLQQIALVAGHAGIAMSLDSVATEGKIPTVSETNVRASDKINEALAVGLGILWIDQDTQELVYVPRPQEESGTATTYVIGNNHSADPYHLCMSDIQVGLDADVVYNSIRVALTSDTETFVVVKDEDSIELWGESVLDTTINTTDATELERWATSIYSATPTKLVKSVSTQTIDRLGNLTQAAVFTPGTLVGVNYTQNELAIDDYYTAVSVSQEFDVNNWTTTLELWKEV